MRFIILLIVLLLVSCGSHPLNTTDAQRSQEIREFFADIFEPAPAPTKPKIPFKAACFNHLRAIYFIINSRDALEKSGIPDGIRKVIPKDLEKLKDQSLETILKTLSAQKDSYFEETQTEIETALKDFKFELEQLKSIKIPKLGMAWTEFFQKILNNYFPNLALEDKKRILAFAIRRMTAETTPTQSLLYWVYASGPYFQKYLQLMADYLEPGDDEKLKELQEGLKKIKGQLPSIHPYHLNLYVEELHEKGVDLTDLKSLGAASVGEAYEAKIKTTGKKIVVKFMRPGIDDIVKREREFFKNQALLPALKESFEQIAEQINEELDYRIELTKIKKGIPAYEGDKTYPIHVVRPIDNFPNSQKYFAMELVDGKTFEQLGKTKLEKFAKSILWERVARKFMKQAFFALQDAFFHGDLHDGNIMVVFDPKVDLQKDVTREEVQKIIDDGLIKAVLIDFGNAHSLTQDERKRLHVIFSSATKISNSSQDFLESMYPEKPDLGPILALLNQTVFNAENREDSAPKKIGKAMDILLENELVIPGFLMAFKRTVGMLDKIHEKLEFKGSASLHHIAQDTYINDIKIMVDEMSVNSRVSFLNGILLQGQAAEWESEKLEEFLSKSDMKKEWMRLRETGDWYELGNYVLPSLIEKLLKKEDASSDQDKPKDEISALDYFKEKIISGFAVEWESTQIAALLDKPEAKQDWINLRAKKETKLTDLIDFITPIASTHGKSEAYAQFEAQLVSDLLQNPTAKEKWTPLKEAWLNEKNRDKKAEKLVALINIVEPYLLEKAEKFLTKDKKEQDSENDSKDFISSEALWELELKLIALFLDLPPEHELLTALKKIKTVFDNKETAWYSKAYAGIQLINSMPKALGTKTLDLAGKLISKTDCWYAGYVIALWKWNRG